MGTNLFNPSTSVYSSLISTDTLANTSSNQIVNTSYQTIHEVASGKGVICGGWIACNYNGTNTLTVKITVDGQVMTTYTSYVLDTGSSSTSISQASIPNIYYKTSIKIEVKSSNAGGVSGYWTILNAAR